MATLQHPGRCAAQSRASPAAVAAASREVRSGDAILAFVDDWARRSALALRHARGSASCILQRAALASGVIAGLYLRGLAFEYRAGWESTFLDAPTVRAILAFVYAPGTC
jgi:hypothetical protein